MMSLVKWYILGFAIIGARIAFRRWYPVGRIELNKERISYQINTIMTYYDNIFELRVKMDFLSHRMLFGNQFKIFHENSQERESKIKRIRDRLEDYVKRMRKSYPTFDDFEKFMTGINEDLNEFGEGWWDSQADKAHEMLTYFVEELEDGKDQFKIAEKKFPEIEAAIREVNEYGYFDITLVKPTAPTGLTKRNIIVLELLNTNSTSMVEYLQGINLKIQGRLNMATSILNQYTNEAFIHPLKMILNCHKDMRWSIVEMYGIELSQFNPNYG